MTFEEIKELIDMVKDSGVAELEVQRGENRVWIKRSVGVSQEFAVHSASAAPAAYVPPPAPFMPAAPNPAPAPAPAPEADQPIDLTSDPSLVLVKSPIVGTFYEAPAPNAAPFVKVGDTIQPGKVLCIIESMKLMNEIEAEISGVVVAKLVDNAKPVEYGEAMFAIRPS
jgi:acetyl-CoA carboxylase biotin carboxyl carrier protein